MLEDGFPLYAAVLLLVIASGLIYAVKDFIGSQRKEDLEKLSKQSDLNRDNRRVDEYNQRK